MTIAFYIAAVIAIVATVMVITRSEAIHALLYLIVSLLAAAVAFYVLGAPFVAALEVIIYAGAIMVLFIFVVMLLNLGPQAAEQESKWIEPSVWVGPALLAVMLACEFVVVLWMGPSKMAGMQSVPVNDVGVSMFSTYLLGVELASMLLLGGLVGAYHIGRHSEERKKETGHERHSH